MTYDTLDPKQVTLLLQHREELLKAKRETDERLAEIETKLLASNHGVVAALKGTLWEFEGDTDNENVPALSAQQCHELVWPAHDLEDTDDGLTNNRLPRAVEDAFMMCGYRESIALGSYGGFKNVELRRQDRVTSIYFTPRIGGSILAAAKELGLRLSFQDAHLDAELELNRATLKLSYVKDVVSRAEALLGKENVLSENPF